MSSLSYTFSLPCYFLFHLPFQSSAFSLFFFSVFHAFIHLEIFFSIPLFFPLTSIPLFRFCCSFTILIIYLCLVSYSLSFSLLILCLLLLFPAVLLLAIKLFSIEHLSAFHLSTLYLSTFYLSISYRAPLFLPSSLPYPPFLPIIAPTFPAPSPLSFIHFSIFFSSFLTFLPLLFLHFPSLHTFVSSSLPGFYSNALLSPYSSFPLNSLPSLSPLPTSPASCTSLFSPNEAPVSIIRQ